MLRKLKIIFRIIILILCISTVISVITVPCISIATIMDAGSIILHFSDKYKQPIESVSTHPYSLGEKLFDPDISDELYQKYQQVFLPFDDALLSTDEIIKIKLSVGNDEDVLPITLSDKMYNGVKTFVNQNYSLMIIFLTLTLIFMIAAFILSLFPLTKKISILNLCISALSLFFMIGYVLVINNGIVASFNFDYKIIGEKAFLADINHWIFLPVICCSLSTILFIIRVVICFKNIFAVDETNTISLENSSQKTDISESLNQSPVIQCLKGSCKGLEAVIFPNESIVIGRDPAVANIIINSDKISKKHCTIWYDDEKGQYAVTDHSQNGTFTENGEQLFKDSPNFLPDGSIIYLCDQDCIFQLGRIRK